MIRYQVRSKELIDLVNEVKSKRLIMSPYFQRNLVWRDVHKVDFVKTILMGLPFPQIFIAKGSIDLENMTTTSCIVDGQQRMNTIVEFTTNRLQVDSQFFKDLDPSIQEEILKYQIPIIDLDLETDDPIVREMFKRLNRTFYSLNSIEKLSTEYSASEFMLFAKHLTDEIIFEADDEDILLVDPTIPNDFIEWAKINDAEYFKKLIVEGDIFSHYELSRQTHLMYVLNLLATSIDGVYTRNDLAIRYLDDYKECLETKDEIIKRFDLTAKLILDLNLNSSSYWFNKANMFTLFLYFNGRNKTLDQDDLDIIKHKLIEFEANIPPDYQIAAKEGVNNKKERLIRKEHIEILLHEE